MMFSMCKRIISLVLLLVAGGISVQAQQTCSNATLNGTYYYLANGSVVSGGQTLPFAELSQLVFDGKGGVTGQAATNDNGVFASFSFAGMYSVQASCKGGLTLSANPPAAGPFDFQILDGGKSISMAFSGANAVIVGHAYLATTGTVQCGRGLFTGSYAFQFTGSAGGLLRSEEGQMVSDGDVNLSVSSVLDINGSPLLNPGTGNYSLHSDCSGSAFIASQSGNTNYSFGMVDNGRSILFLRTDSGTVVSGKAETQALTASVLPDFAYGGGFYSAIYFANTGSTAVSFPVNFFGDAGGPLTVPSVHGSTTTINLPPQGTAIVEAPNDGPLVQGYASAFLPSGVVSYGIFRKSTRSSRSRGDCAAFRGVLHAQDAGLGRHQLRDRGGHCESERGGEHRDHYRARRRGQLDWNPHDFIGRAREDGRSAARCFRTGGHGGETRGRRF